MSTHATTRITPEEYLERERAAEYRSEYLEGETFALAGASFAHARIVMNLVIALGLQLRGRPCSAFATDLRVAVSRKGLYTYPDVFVVCGEPKFIDAVPDTVTNPKVIVEVLSESTKDYDRGGKFTQYRRIASLSEYLLVAQDEPHVEHFVKQPDGSWNLTETSDAAATVALPTIDCRLSLADVYEKIEFKRA
jgi:Uma2 family endonuclease